MKNLKSGILTPALFAASALFASTTFAAEDPIQQAYKSSNVKAGKFVKRLNKRLLVLTMVATALQKKSMANGSFTSG